MTYNTLINAYCRQGLLEEAFELMGSISGKGLKPCLCTYNAIMKGLCKKGKYLRAKGVLNEMLKIGLSPDTATYNILLGECCRNDNMMDAERIFDEISCDPIVGDLRDKKENCSTRRGFRMGTGFREFPQTRRGRGFSLLEFYSLFKCFTIV